MRAQLLVGCAALALGACGSRNTANNDVNAAAANNLMLEQNAAAMGGMDANAATNAATENMMMNDLTNNDADINLANGI